MLLLPQIFQITVSVLAAETAAPSLIRKHRVACVRVRARVYVCGWTVGLWAGPSGPF